MKLADKQLYSQVKDKKITIRQFKTRCMEKLNGSKMKFIDYDDVIHLIHPDCQNLDTEKVNAWALAAFKQQLEKLPL